METALGFLQRCQNATTIAELNDMFGSAIGALGFDTFAFVELHVPGRPMRPRFLFGKTNTEWDQYYGARRLYRIDPVVPHLFSEVQPFTWNDVQDWEETPERRALFAAAREAGAGEGFIVPIHGAAGETHLVKLTTPELEVDPAIRPTVHALCQLYAAHGRTLYEAGPEPAPRLEPCPLTQREAECITLVAEGKSDWEIGVILGISSHTVHTLIERAKKRIGVRTRLQVALTALRKGWLIDL